MINDSGLILSARDIGACGGRVLNYHAAPLPTYRGAASNVRFILNNEAQVWGTLHYVLPTLDTGDTIFQSPTVNIDPSKSAYTIYIELLTKLTSLLIRFFHEIEQDRLPTATPQDESMARIFSFPLKNDIRALRRKGFRFLSIRDWKIVVRSLFRGQLPFQHQ